MATRAVAIVLVCVLGAHANIQHPMCDVAVHLQHRIAGVLDGVWWLEVQMSLSHVQLGHVEIVPGNAAIVTHSDAVTAPAQWLVFDGVLQAYAACQRRVVTDVVPSDADRVTIPFARLSSLLGFPFTWVVGRGILVSGAALPATVISDSGSAHGATLDGFQAVFNGVAVNLTVAPWRAGVGLPRMLSSTCGTLLVLPSLSLDVCARTTSCRGTTCVPQVYVHDGADVILGPDLLADDGATLVVVADDAGFQLHVAWTGEWWWWHYGAWFMLLVVAIYVARLWMLEPVATTDLLTRRGLAVFNVLIVLFLFGGSSIYAVLHLVPAITRTTQCDHVTAAALAAGVVALCVMCVSVTVYEIARARTHLTSATRGCTSLLACTTVAVLSAGADVRDLQTLSAAGSACIWFLLVGYNVAHSVVARRSVHPLCVVCIVLASPGIATIGLVPLSAMFGVSSHVFPAVLAVLLVEISMTAVLRSAVN